MKPLTQEWIEKAEDDLRAANWLMRAPRVAFDAVGFHTQQCAEKYMKAVLQERTIPFPKTHDLEELLDLIQPALPEIEILRERAKFLSDLAVESRYPGSWANESTAQRALQDCAAIRTEMHRLLGLNPENSESSP